VKRVWNTNEIRVINGGIEKVGDRDQGRSPLVAVTQNMVVTRTESTTKKTRSIRSAVGIMTVKVITKIALDIVDIKAATDVIAPDQETARKIEILKEGKITGKTRGAPRHPTKTR